jgi:uncharacterized protein (TIGR00299 family) protein
VANEGGLHLWIDASAGIAGDMLLGALLDTGAPLEAVRAAVSTVLPGEVDVQTAVVQRAGLRALQVTVHSRAEDHPHRAWADIRQLLESADLPTAITERALSVFGLLAEAEGRVHGTAPEDVHFHEVGAWDSIADVLGVCAGLAALDVTTITVSPVALGSGRVRTAHGELPVPVPAVLELARGWDVTAGGAGELATPTGMALVAALAAGSGPLPPMRVGAVGVGAGARDVPGRANVVRAVLGTVQHEPAADRMWLLETNVDDLDPRVWPDVLSRLLEAGAADAWLVPILMKKGRPAHTLCVLAHDAGRDALREAMFTLTPTLGVRESPVSRTALERDWRTVAVSGGSVRIKLGLRGGRIVTATPEYDDAEALAQHHGVPVRQVLDEAGAAAAAIGLGPGEHAQPGAAI